MEVILLERVAKLGQMGETVRVKDGYARNFLLPGNKALRATEANKKRFETQKAQLEERNATARTDAERVADRHGRIDGISPGGLTTWSPPALASQNETSPPPDSVSGFLTTQGEV